MLYLLSGISLLLIIFERPSILVYRQMGGVEQVLAFAFLAADVITYAVVIILMSRLDVEKHIEEDQKKIKENQKKAANI